MWLRRIFLLSMASVAFACGLDVVGTVVDPGAPATPDSLEPPNTPDATVDDAPPTGPDAEIDAGSDAVVDAPPQTFLSLTTTTPPADLDLDVEGVLGWAHWGLDANKDAFNQRVGFVGAIPTFQLTVQSGGINLRTFQDNRTTIRWAQGTPTQSTTGTKHGVYSKDNRPTFTLRVPVTSATNELVVYASLFKAAASFSVSLGEGDDAPTKTATFDEDGDNLDLRFAIGHHVEKDTMLVVRWSLDQKHDQGNSNVTLIAATLR
ncbi:MAG: hypothetical protein BGO98_32640 [Myxococcales bacterium 68-20]|nr:hypothetical protein [Myxococcales bacterium]OJY18483.1 MAG: hypothetical protein BGO98_32640 [Myxococcales bacterium 68-20]